MKQLARTITLITGAASFSASADVKTFVVDMAPLNSSGVDAEITMTITDAKTLTVSIVASGLEPGKPHPQHIHGFQKPKTDATCPTIEADANGDGIVDVGEGLPDYGPIILPLVPFDLVDDFGNLEYEATFTINPGTMQPLHKRVVVMHGMTINGNGGYVPSLPIACGQIEEVF
jgi:hypothetical protein